LDFGNGDIIVEYLEKPGAKLKYTRAEARPDSRLHQQKDR